MEESFNNPTGSFAGQEGEAFTGANAQLANQSVITGMGGLGSTGGGLMARATNEGGWCPELTTETGSGKGSCNCPTSGSMTFDLVDLKPLLTKETMTGPIDSQASIRLDACKFSGGSGTSAINIVGNGSAYAKLKATSLNPLSDDAYALASVHLSVTGVPDEATTRDIKVDADVMYKEKILYVAVTISSGTIAVGVSTGAEGYNAETKTGTVVILDKSGKTTCTLNNGTGTCTDPNGNVRDVSA
jgi:hypothetical protein